MKNTILFLLAGLILLLAGCGGGGGGGSTGGGSGIPVSGRVLWIENGGATVPQSSVRATGGTTSVLTDAADGSFTLTVPVNTNSLTVTYSSGGTPIVRTFTVAPITSERDLGDLYIGPSTVSVTGRIIDSQTGAGVSGALVKLGGVQATTSAGGTFTLSGVAYSSSLAVFLGLQGEVSRAGYFTQFFSPPGAAVGGVVNVGDIALTPEGSGNPPPLPYNISGSATPVAKGAGATAELLSGGAVIRTNVADANGKFTFWAPVGTYGVRVTKGSEIASGTATVAATNQVVNVNVVFP